jgi:predicted kinase
MKTLICTVGLPRSGKSTWAKMQNWPIVNPDSVRLAIHGQAFNSHAEPFVWAVVHCMINALFLAGHETIILDATNVTRKRRDAFQSDDWVTLFKLFDTDKEICLERAQNNPELIPVIERMAENFEPLGQDEIVAP